MLQRMAVPVVNSGSIECKELSPPPVKQHSERMHEQWQGEKKTLSGQTVDE